LQTHHINPLVYSGWFSRQAQGQRNLVVFKEVLAVSEVFDGGRKDFPRRRLQLAGRCAGLLIFKASFYRWTNLDLAGPGQLLYLFLN